MTESILQTAKHEIAPPSGGGGGIGIIQYGAGNIFSLTSALKRLGITYGMVNTVADMEQFDRFIIPGVGHAGAAMNKLLQTGMVESIKALTRPTLGICVGMQLLTAHSEEGDANLLNIIPVKTLKFEADSEHKVPHTGWNKILLEKESPLFENVPQGSYFYFVHSYYIEYNPTYTLALTNYSTRFSASIWHNNFFGVQFHPEKSGAYGETLLINFSNL